MHENYQINAKTTLSRFYIFDNPNAYIEYPESHPHFPIGYLFRQDPDNWLDPTEDFTYSLGHPRGQSAEWEDITIGALCNGNGDMVPCYERHEACQGLKICPLAKLPPNNGRHTSATRQDVTARLTLEQDVIHSPARDVFERTSALITGLRRRGCHSEEFEMVHRSEAEQAAFDAVQQHHAELQRGWVDAVSRCKGQLYFNYDSQDRPFIHCEFYHGVDSRAHLVTYIDPGHFDVDYLEAVFWGDKEEADAIEEWARVEGCGPKALCTTIKNTTSRRTHCPSDHRTADGRLEQPLLEHLTCQTRFRVYEPKEDYRKQCPYIFITVVGEHTHPVPLPTKTPPRVRALLFDLFAQIGISLADLTPRRFLRHPVVTAFLRKAFPKSISPTPADIHPSLANRAHLGMYIRQAKRDVYPHGSDWDGLLYRYKFQVENYPVEAQYIRRIIDLDASGMELHPDDNDHRATDKSDRIRIIVCMTPDGSRRLAAAPYIQMDVSHKRIKGYYIVFARVYINRENAVAHQRYFEEIDQIVLQDTGQRIRWRHLDATSLDDYSGCVLQATGDQGGGQGKGFGLFLQARAQTEPYQNKYDLHEPHRLLSSLGPYEHLWRIHRVCSIHMRRNIQVIAVPEHVRNMMRSLICVRHDSWNETIQAIRDEGGRAGQDWVANKIDSKFAFEGVCWQKSFIPLDIWKAGDRDDNMIEESHMDINQDGRYNSLLGAVEKGERFDIMKLKSIEMIETLGIRPSYASGHLWENMARRVIRQNLKRGRKFRGADEQIAVHNQRITQTEQKYRNMDERYRDQRRKLEALEHRIPPATDNQLSGTRKTVDTAYKSLRTLWSTLEDLSHRATLMDKGSGRDSDGPCRTRQHRASSVRMEVGKADEDDFDFEIGVV
ncbi:hypothetical protein BDZ89DRAFT_1169676 [Hymenopellis radicata]|nr:hypothetical protein BDZ89DRAFT_1169676 [Hymenopellis radicata]